MMLETIDVSQQITAFLENIPDEQWAIYNCVLSRAHRSGLRFALGGAIAFAGYSGRVRNTKDLDIYVTPDGREQAKRILTQCGMKDYFDKLPYDRSWIYRGKSPDAIVDIIWAMANGRAECDPEWLSDGPLVEARGQSFHLIPPEELIWSKLYVLQRERSDWPDILNVVEVSGPMINWDHLLRRIGDDLPLLRGLLSVYQWLSPEGAKELPRSLWNKVDLPQPSSGMSHVKLLDTRDWFGNPSVQKTRS